MSIKLRSGSSRARIRTSGSGTGRVFRACNPKFVLPVNPADAPGLRVWYKADSLALSHGDPVSSWPDSSGNGKTLVRTDGFAASITLSSAPNTGGDPSKYAYDLFGGKPAVYFVSVYYGIMKVINAGLPTGSQARTVYVVAQTRADGASNGYQMLLAWGDTSAAMKRFSIFRSGTGGSGEALVGPEFYSGDDYNPPTKTAGLYSIFQPSGGWGPIGGGDGSLGPEDSAAFIMSWPYSAGTTADSNPVYVNGVAGTPNGSFLPVSDVPDTDSGGTTLWVGKGPWTGDSQPWGHWSGWIAEIIVYNVAHDVTTRKGIEQYLSTKYSIPAF